MGYDGYETFKRALFYVRTSRFLWPFAFVIALAGGGSASFSLWVQSPIQRGLWAPHAEQEKTVAGRRGIRPLISGAAELPERS